MAKYNSKIMIIDSIIRYSNFTVLCGSNDYLKGWSNNQIKKLIGNNVIIENIGINVNRVAISCNKDINIVIPQTETEGFYVSDIVYR